MFEKYELLFHRVIEYKTNSNTKILVNNVLSQVTPEPCESIHSQQRFISLVGEYIREDSHSSYRLLKLGCGMTHVTWTFPTGPARK